MMVAPLNQVAQYERVKFNEGLHGKRTRYMGFSQEADDAWNELQEVGVVRLSPEEQMSMEVDSIPDLDRKDYTVYAVDHCLDYLRQVALCRGSLDLVAWKNLEDGTESPKYDQARVCHKYEPLRDWANLHRAGNSSQVGELTGDQLKKWGWQDGFYVGGVELPKVYDWIPVE
ncbi:hypothetical protein LA080_006635 [Diaporthe eres]|nr:hypothetical protein LA080_006635 [Diaporthe eres]